MLDWLPSVSSFVAKATLFDWAIVVGGLSILLYWLGTWNHDHFRRRGVPFERPLPFLGNMGPIALGRKSFFDYLLDLYKQAEGYQAIGFFQMFRPTLLIRNPEIIKLVTVKDFDHFVNHQQIISEKVEPMFSRNLFSLNGQDWRDMRATLSPAFTSSKMRNIFKLVDLCGEQMANFLHKKLKSGPDLYEVEMKDFFSRFANDVIATSAFGIECDSLGQPENEFYLMGVDLTKQKGIQALIFVGHLCIPKVMEFFRIPFKSPKVSKFFHNVVHDTINERQSKGIYRPDMLQLLMQARDGQLKTEAGDEQDDIKGAKAQKLSDVDVTAQAVIFFFAGFDTVSTALSYCAYSLMRYPEMQQRLQREVDEAFDQNAGRLTYEAVQGLKYMDKFLSEVLRFYSTMPLIDRVCTKDFTIPAHADVPAYTVRKGDIVWIAVAPIHHDPKFWEEPEKFDPERFSEENKHKIKPFTYMPFGIGPRGCIGSRFALMEMKVALAHILRHFDVKIAPKTPKKLEYMTNDLGGEIKGGCWVGISPRAQ